MPDFLVENEEAREREWDEGKRTFTFRKRQRSEKEK